MKSRKHNFAKDLPKFATGEEFDALSDLDKEKVARYFERRILSTSEKAEVEQLKKIGRPKVGQGVRVISLSVEKSLLNRADAYAKRHGMKRAELFAKGLQKVLPKAS
jgi:hypothetical protein